LDSINHRNAEVRIEPRTGESSAPAVGWSCWIHRRATIRETPSLEVQTGRPALTLSSLPTLAETRVTMPDDSIEQAVGELKRAAKDFARAAVDLSRRAAKKAEAAAKDPPGSTKRAAQVVSQELDKAAKEIDRILRDL
jgi:hypothetical protein